MPQSYESTQGFMPARQMHDIERFFNFKCGHNTLTKTPLHDELLIPLLEQQQILKETWHETDDSNETSPRHDHNLFS
jgi:hypothetical protein